MKGIQIKDHGMKILNFANDSTVFLTRIQPILNTYKKPSGSILFLFFFQKVRPSGWGI